MTASRRIGTAVAVALALVLQFPLLRSLRLWLDGSFMVEESWAGALVTKTTHRACRVLVENRPDYHFELMESVILRYPLPWNEMNCSASSFLSRSPVTFDIAHAATAWATGELEPWLRYYHKDVQGTRRKRLVDGVVVTFGQTRPFANYTAHERNNDYDAVIGVSCGTHPPLDYLYEAPNRYCVLHKACGHKGYVPCNDTALLKRSCWVSPQEHTNGGSSHQCFFLPTDLPQLSNSSRSRQRGGGAPNQQPNEQHSHEHFITACTLFHKHQRSLIEALSRLKRFNASRDMQLLLYGRGKADLPPPYRNLEPHQRPARVARVVESDFLQFQHSIASRCDLMLPLIQPPSDYLKGKLSGWISQAIGYKLPTVLHTALHAIYGPYLTAPSLTYNDTESFASALDAMLIRLQAGN